MSGPSSGTWLSLTPPSPSWMSPLPPGPFRVVAPATLLHLLVCVCTSARINSLGQVRWCVGRSWGTGHSERGDRDLL